MDSKETSDQKGKYLLRNYWESLIMEKTKGIVSKTDMCQCEKCFLDICALALNKLPPHYVTTDRGSLMVKVPTANAKTELELTILISRCAKLVSEKPIHDV
ncbi:MAG: late competence development ComFB family protein [Clostridiales bacterium]|nr:late competence development ComFB family protein [Clostridiales bacterium]